MRTLNIHLKEHHQPDNVQLEDDYENCDILDISDILQVDGIDDTMEGYHSIEENEDIYFDLLERNCIA